MLLYEDVFNMVAVCKTAKGEVQQYPLQVTKGKEHLCYIPAENVVMESSIPANLKLATPIFKKPSAKKPKPNEKLDVESQAKDTKNEEEMDAEAENDQGVDEDEKRVDDASPKHRLRLTRKRPASTLEDVHP